MTIVSFSINWLDRVISPSMSSLPEKKHLLKRASLTGLYNLDGESGRPTIIGNIYKPIRSMS